LAFGTPCSLPEVPDLNAVVAHSTRQRGGSGMKRLWMDISTHPISAGGFLVCWLAVYGYTFLTWSRGISNLAVLLHLASPVISGALVAWWRFPLHESLLDGRWRPAGPPLSGVLVAVVVVSVVFLREGVRAGLSGSWRVADAGGFLLSWLVAAALLGAIGSVLALFGAVLSRSLAGHLKKQTS
jgi:hypothetical protein